MRRFLDAAYAASGMPWNEVAQLRNSEGKKIRRWLSEALEPRRRPLSASTVSDVARIRAKALPQRAVGALKFAPALPPALPWASLGVEGAGLVALIEALSVFRLKTPLIRTLARHLEPGVDQFLIDTPFFVDAELRTEGKEEG